MKKDLLKGMSHGIPIMLGYLSVSFGIGIMAVRAGITPFQATMISLTNLTSAGQAAGIGVIASAGTLFEMALVQFTINLRYALMSLSLSQKLDKKKFTLPKRLAASYGITDEIFAVCSAQKEALTPAYMCGMIFIATAGWVAGTILGAEAGSILPKSVTDAMGIVLYGMFIAIFIPPVRKQKSVLFTITAAAALSVLFKYAVKGVSAGFAIIICAVIASAAAALLFPVDEEETDEKEAAG